MTEADLIATLTAAFGRTSPRENAAMTCDAEIVRIGDVRYALSIDEFSAAEDAFDTADPERLGHNLVAATISDVHAAGGTPRFFMQALVLPPATEAAFATRLAAGMARALDACGCAMLGGDIGSAPDWRFTGWCMGPVARPLTRLLPEGDADLWVSGPLGDANAARAGRLPTPLFELRLPLVDRLRAHAVACIDTSGGLWDAVWTLTRLNPTHAFALDLSAVPLADTVLPVCRRAGIPPAAALIGGAGEYEYLFAAPAAHRATFETVGATRIGHATPHAAGGFAIRHAGRERPAPPCPDARAFTRFDDYLAAVIATARLLDCATEPETKAVS